MNWERAEWVEIPQRLVAGKETGSTERYHFGSLRIV